MNHAVVTTSFATNTEKLSKSKEVTILFLSNRCFTFANGCYTEDRKLHAPQKDFPFERGFALSSTGLQP